ncbi:MAG: 50S ribosomal protein L25 [Chloroflexota bacterium]
MATLELGAGPRKLIGRKVKQLRRQGIIPVVVYGNVEEALSLQVPEREFERTLRDGGNSQLIQLSVEDGSKHNVLLRDLQRHPVRHTLLHADFYAINMSEKQQVSIPLVPVNEPAAMASGLMVLQAMDTVEIEALPNAIPATIEVDITDLTLESSITVADLPAIEGVEYLSEAEEPVFNMLASRVSLEDEELEGEVAEGEAEDESSEDDSEE